MRRWYQIFSNYFLRPYYEWKLRKPLPYNKYGLHVIVEAGVFHPGFFYSTEFLLDHLLTLPLENTSVLELGCGSGVISLALARRRAKVTAIDVNQKAIDGLKQNAVRNNVQLDIRLSDQFSSLPGEKFDLIAINPPFYNKEANSEAEQAWFCGPQFEYFTRLFPALLSHVKPQGMVRMVLSDACNINRIREIAADSGLVMSVVMEKKFRFETQWIFEVLDK